MRDEVALVRTFATPVWQGIEPLRTSVHAEQGQRRCPSAAAPYSLRDPLGTGPRCEGCVQEYDLILVEVITRFRQQAAALNPAGWARVVAGHLAGDRIRERRRELGALTRVDVRGRIKSLTAYCPTPWHARLLVLILDEVGKTLPVPAEIWPLDRWLEARGAGTVHDLRSEIAEVLELARTHGGTVCLGGVRMSWVEAYVERPLAQRPRQLLSLDQSDYVTVASPEADADVPAASAVFRRVLDDLRRGIPVRRSLAGHVATQFGRAAAARLLADELGYRRVAADLEQQFRLEVGPVLSAA